MKKETRTLILSLAVANLLTSFIGGAVLGQGLHLVETLQSFRFDSVLAYLMGSFIAFFIILFCRTRRLPPLRLLSFLSVIPVLSLLLLLRSSPLVSFFQEALFALLLCLYFSVGASLRAVRSDIAAIHSSQGLTISEGSYSMGYLLGLGFQTLGAHELSTLFLANLGLIALIFCCDIFSALQVSENFPEAEGIQKPLLQLPAFFWQSLVLFFGMTTCVQLGTQRIAGIVHGVYPLMAFEVGVSIAPFVAGFLDLKLVLFQNFYRGSNLTFKSGDFSWNAALIFVLAVSAIGLATALLAGNLYLISFGFLAIGAFGYEFLSLALLGALGKEPGQVMMAFGINGFLVSMTYWILLQFNEANWLALMLTFIFSGLACIVSSRWSPSEGHS